MTRPLRLKWPRRAGEPESDRATRAGQSGAVLNVAVDPARALDLQYRRAQIVERINGYFGYRAVAELRIVPTVELLPGPTRVETAGTTSPGQTGPDALSDAKVAYHTAGAADLEDSSGLLTAIADDSLRNALARMQAGLARNRRPPAA